MVKIPKHGKPQFIKPEDVQDGDLATIIEPPYIQSADKSKYGKERTIVTFNLHRVKEIYRLGLNNTATTGWWTLAAKTLKEACDLAKAGVHLLYDRRRCADLPKAQIVF